ncbi:MAG: hypothetical protein H0V82_07690 [Candidatus Protochlamydia sp.]|nr:hypothetical protein [Candidatus Protochlamydia sp.]
MKFVNYIFFILLCNFSLASAEILFPKEMYADICIDTFQEKNHHTEVELSNGTRWTYPDTQLFEGLNGWKKGDRIQIVYIGSLSRQYYLQNMSCTGSIPVKLISAGEALNQIQKIETTYNFDNEPIAYDITLTDNSLWHVGHWSGMWMKEWQAGDQIIVSPADFLFGKATHILINVNRPLNGKSKLCSNIRAELWACDNSVRMSEDANKRQFEDWDVNIQNISYSEEGCVFTLNNGIICHGCLPKKLWNEQDLVTLFFDKGLKIKNLTCSESLPVTFEIDQGNLKTYRIEKFSSHGRHINLDNGSIWFENSYSLEKWSINDRIVIIPLKKPIFDMTTHLLINLDTSSEDGMPDWKDATLIKK